MPHLDGFSVLAHLQQEPDYRDLPVLVLTAKTLTVEEQGRLQERVRTVIQKGGLERAALIQELQAALQTYGHRRNG
jgi:CheY-like chemotaxis protein